MWCRRDAACCVDQIWLSGETCGETCAARWNEGSLQSCCHNIRLQLVHTSSTRSRDRAETGTAQAGGAHRPAQPLLPRASPSGYWAEQECTVNRLQNPSHQPKSAPSGASSLSTPEVTGSVQDGRGTGPAFGLWDTVTTTPDSVARCQQLC